MTKIVYNACFGGFALSKLACQRYWEIKGQQVWIEEDKEFSSVGLFTVWLVPYEERVTTNSKSFNSMSMEERITIIESIMSKLGMRGRFLVTTLFLFKL